MDSIINERARLHEWERSIINREREYDTDERDLAMIEAGREVIRAALLARMDKFE